MVTPPTFCSGYRANRSATAGAHLPPKYPSCRGITQDFAKSFSGQHGQPKYLSKRTVNIGNQWHEFNKCLECEIAPVEDQNVQPTDREAHVRYGPILLQKSAMTGAWHLARTYSSSCLPSAR